MNLLRSPVPQRPIHRPLPKILRHVTLGLALAATAQAQESFGGPPLSLLHDVPGEVPSLGVAGHSGSRGANVAHLPLGPQDAGRWQPAPHGGRLWRLRLECPGAPALLLRFGRFQLAPGAALFVYDDLGEELRGAFTHLSQRPDGRLDLAPLAASAVTLEYFEPAGAEGSGELVLESVLPAWLPPALERHGAAPGVRPKSTGPGQERGAPEVRSSPPCNVDVACPEGEGFLLAARSVVAIVNLNEFCTGVLLNNTSGDGTPYVLTARHCGNLNMATFRFNWLRSACDDPEAAPERMNDVITGSALVASDGDVDFQLVRLAAMPPPEFGAVYAGWDRSGVAPERSACLHHPAGDFMKVSLDADAPKARKKYWHVKKWETGMTHRGSSGAPLFDPEQRVIGSLEGGDSTCKDPRNDYFPRLEKIWESVGEALDPGSSGALRLDALERTEVDLTFALAGLSPAQPSTEDDQLTLLGNGFGERLSVIVDGEKLHWRAVKRVSNSRVTLEVPELSAGKHWVKVWQGGESELIHFTVSAPAPETEDAAGGAPRGGTREGTREGTR